MVKQSHNRRSTLIVLIAVLALMALAACQPPASQTNIAPITNAVPTSATSAPTVGPELAYPAAQPNAGYPATSAFDATLPAPTAGEQQGYNPPAAGAPAVDNLAQVTAKVITSAADAGTAGQSKLHILVVSSQPIGSAPNFLDGKTNQELDVFANSTDVASLKAGDTFTAEIQYKGDETGGKYTIQKVAVKP